MRWGGGRGRCEYVKGKGRRRREEDGEGGAWGGKEMVEVEG